MPQVALAAALVIGWNAAPAPFTPFSVTPGTYYQDVSYDAPSRTLYLTQVEGTVRRIVVSTWRAGAWSAPATASFSGVWRDLEEVLSPDNRTIIFASNRPAVDGGKPLDAFFGGRYRPGRGGNLWSVNRSGTSWGTPMRLPEAVNANTSTFSPAVAADGTLYFMRASGPNQHFHIFVSKPERGVYASSAVAPFSDVRYSDFDPAVASDDSFVIFGSNRPPARSGTADLFIAFHGEDGWTPARDLGAAIDPRGDAIEPRLSPDNRELYFTRSGAPNPIQRVALTRAEPLPAPRPFAGGILEDADSTPTFSADGKTLVYAQSGATRDSIAESHFDGRAWSIRVTASFSGEWNDLDPVFSPDGSYVIFSSTRPLNGRRPEKPALWRVDRTKGQWGVPRPLPATVNDGAFLVSPTVANDGTLYYLHIANHQHRIYRARLKNGSYRKPEPLLLGDALAQDYDPWIAPDQSFLIFASSGRGAGALDRKRRLFAVIRQGDAWSAAVPIRYEGQNASDDSCPVLARDGKTLYFDSDRSGKAQIWELPIGPWLTSLGA